MQEKINLYVEGMKDRLIEMRREIHRHAESAWTEFWTTAFIIDKLREIGYEVYYGADVIEESAMMGMPPAEVLEVMQKRAIEQGANPQLVSAMAGGKTGAMAVLDTGRPGPVVGFRFDIDANDVEEAEDDKHRPFREGFSSINRGTNHACGHDAHAVLGLGLAEALLQVKDDLQGKIKIFFQPAEEGVRGAKAMVASGIVDDVDYMIGTHVGIFCRQVGQLVCAAQGYLATTKIDVEFYGGNPATAGGEPEAGRNALLAAHSAGLNLHAISRHSGGATRINVGTLQAGSGRNVIPAWAKMKMETRGETTELNEYVYNRTMEILEGAATMHEVKVKTIIMGEALACYPNLGFAKELVSIAKNVPGFTDIREEGKVGGSEDYSYFLDRVQERGGEATCIILGTELAAGHHNYYFDINEDVLPLGVKFLGETAYVLSKKNK